MLCKYLKQKQIVSGKVQTDLSARKICPLTDLVLLLVLDTQKRYHFI